MTLPDRDVAVAWVGRMVVDRDGTEIGACTAVYADDATQLAEWVCSELAGVAVLLPAVGASDADGQVRVLVSRADIAGAPTIDVEKHVSAEEEQALYRHYGIPYSREESASVLPTDEPAAAAPSATTDHADSSTFTPDSSVTADGLAATPNGSAARTTSVTPQPVPPVRSEDLTPGGGESGGTGRGRKTLVSGGLAGLAALGATLGVRRLARSRRRSRTERLADRSRAATVALTRRITRPGAGTALGTASAIAALAAVRRRRSQSAAEVQPYDEVTYDRVTYDQV